MNNYMRENGTFEFDGVSSADYGVWITGAGTYNAPPRRFEEITIPGRNGTLTLDQNAFEDIEQTYPAFIRRNFATNIEGLRNQLLSRAGKKVLKDSYHPDEFYLAKYIEGLEVETAAKGVAGRFDLVFKRDPRRFLVSGETPVTMSSGGTITNPTLFASRPLIHAVGYGTVTIGHTTITIANEFSYVDIDCETMDCYSGTQNANAAVTFGGNDFPELPAGATGVTYSNTITQLIITPRWWRL